MNKRGAYSFHVLLLIVFVLLVYYSGIFLKMWEPVTAIFVQSEDNTDALKEWIIDRKDIYKQAAGKANQGVTGLAGTHSLEWGTLAAIDYLVLSDDKYRKESFSEEFDAIHQKKYPDFNVTALAYALKSNAEEEQSYIVTETVYTLKEDSGEEKGDGDRHRGFGLFPGDDIVDVEEEDSKQLKGILNHDLYKTEIQEKTVLHPVRVNTFRGIYTYEYEVAEHYYITDYDNYGNITRVVSTKGPVISGVAYKEDWIRMKHAIVEHAGVKEYLEVYGLKAEEFVTSDDIHRILKLAEDLTYGFDILGKLGYYGHVWPVLEGGRKVTSPFGWRASPFGRGNEFHTGMDIAPLVKGRPGDVLVAAASGKISVHGGYGSARGYYIELECENGLLYRYFHLDGKKPYHSNALSEKVKAGDVIGFMGTTGSSTNVHLHFDASYGRDLPAILKEVNWIDDDKSEDLNRKYIHGRTFIDPCILLKWVAPDIENSCQQQEVRN